ncbi:MAG: hypothetical protein ACJ8HI_06640 [Massilia sp.]
MLKIFLTLLLAGFAAGSSAAIDIPLEACESTLKFRDGSTLVVRSDGRRLVSAELTFKGVRHTLRGKILEGLEQPDLTSIKLKLVATNRCDAVPNSCLEYSLPLIEISLGAIPEDQACVEECLVRFLVQGDSVYRETSSRRAGQASTHPRQAYPGATD